MKIIMLIYYLILLVITILIRLKKRYIKLHYISYFYLPAGEVFEFNVPVKVSNIPDSDTMLPGLFAQNGEFVLDDIAFIPHNLSIIKNSSTSDYQ